MQQYTQGCSLRTDESCDEGAEIERADIPATANYRKYGELCVPRVTKYITGGRVTVIKYCEITSSLRNKLTVTLIKKSDSKDLFALRVIIVSTSS